jgi:hypothetical protein
MAAIEPCRDRILALTATVLVHWLVVGWWWLGGAAPASRFSLDGDSGGSALTVEYVVVTKSAPSPQTPRATLTPPEIESGGAKQSDAPQLPSIRAASAVTLGDGETNPASSGNDDDLAARYRAAVRQTIARYWKQQTGEDLPNGCVLKIGQVVGGQVASAYVDGCDLENSARLRLEAAVLMAQPLPYAGYEAVFLSDLALSL